jgi:hypothetical protein
VVMAYAPFRLRDKIRLVLPTRIMRGRQAKCRQTDKVDLDFIILVSGLEIHQYWV